MWPSIHLPPLPVLYLLGKEPPSMHSIHLGHNLNVSIIFFLFRCLFFLDWRSPNIVAFSWEVPSPLILATILCTFSCSTVTFLEMWIPELVKLFQMWPYHWFLQWHNIGGFILHPIFNDTEHGTGFLHCFTFSMRSITTSRSFFWCYTQLRTCSRVLSSDSWFQYELQVSLAIRTGVFSHCRYRKPLMKVNPPLLFCEVHSSSRHSTSLRGPQNGLQKCPEATSGLQMQLPIRPKATSAGHSEVCWGK